MTLRPLLASLALAATLSCAQAQGMSSWTLYKGAGPAKSLVYETGGRAPFAVICEKYELGLWVVSNETGARAKTGSFSLAGANKQFFFYSGPARPERDGMAIQVPLPFNAPVFALIEKGDFLIRETSGKVIAEVKIGSPQVKDFVFDCRKP
jgi:hypothetical protein